MKPQREPRAEQFEELLSAGTDQDVSAQMHPAVSESVDAEVSEMVALARYLQATPSLMADPDFAKRLEGKVLAHSVQPRQTKAARRKGHGLPGWAPQMWVTFAAILLFMLIGTGTVLAAATRAENPDNPLYGVKVWEQHAQLSLASSPQNQAEVSMQIIRDRLKTAASIANASHADAYQQTIQDADRRINAVSKIINSLPNSADRRRLSNELTTLKTDARQTLYSLLSRLPLTAQLVTTTFLGHLGAPVPSIQSATVVITGNPPEQARITITGTNLTSHTRLAINNRLVGGNCALQQNNTCVFVISWYNQSPPGLIAVHNEDNTVTQTTVITSTYAGGGNRGNGDGENNRNGGNNGVEDYNEDGGHGIGKIEKGNHGGGRGGRGHRHATAS